MTMVLAMGDGRRRRQGPFGVFFWGWFSRGYSVGAKTHKHPHIQKQERAKRSKELISISLGNGICQQLGVCVCLELVVHLSSSSFFFAMEIERLPFVQPWLTKG